ncbi:P-loop NTPase fold protein [Halomonas sp. ND22Bw]|uniref:P-loop NTPase fold protein n=1 Tax=Halomonas sp. ND22Bw TaxID=2054178 RepID=UPI0011B24022
MQTLISQIKQLFNDATLTSVVVLSGGWGVGKTYFVNNSLKLDGDFNGFFYISCYGLGSKDEFDDLLVIKSSDYDSGAVYNSIRKGWGGFSKALNSYDRQLGAVVSSAELVTKFAKEKYLAKLKGKTFIVDDFDRLDESVQKGVLSSLAHLSEKGNRFLILCDAGKLKVKDDLEKTVSAVLKFPDQDESIYTILAKDAGLPAEWANDVSRLAVSIGVKNLRIYKRALAKVFSIYIRLMKNKGFSELHFFERYVPQILFLHECQKEFEEVEDLKSALSVEALWSFDKSEEKPKNDAAGFVAEKFFDCKFLMPHEFPDLIVDYCFDYRVSTDDVVSFVDSDAPGEGTLREKLSFSVDKWSEEQFEELVCQLEHRVFVDPESSALKEWSYLADIYLCFVDNQVIDCPADDALARIEEILDTCCFNASFTDGFTVSHNSRLFPSAKYHEAVDRSVKAMAEKHAHHRAAEYRSGKIGLGDLVELLVSDYKHSPIIDIELADAIALHLKSMELGELAYLIMVVSSRYEASNIGEFLCDEREGLKRIEESASKTRDFLPASRRKGKLKQLCEVLSRAIQKLSDN